LELVKKDVYVVVLEFFQTGWLLPKYNANTLILIPKIQMLIILINIDLLPLNFKFKIITKVLEDMLSLVLSNIRNKEDLLKEH
jgi:hypothetical protein